MKVKLIYVYGDVSRCYECGYTEQLRFEDTEWEEISQEDFNKVDSILRRKCTEYKHTLLIVNPGVQEQKEVIAKSIKEFIDQHDKEKKRIENAQKEYTKKQKEAKKKRELKKLAELQAKYGVQSENSEI